MSDERRHTLSETLTNKLRQYLRENGLPLESMDDMIDNLLDSERINHFLNFEVGDILVADTKREPDDIQSASAVDATLNELVQQSLDACPTNPEYAALSEEEILNKVSDLTRRASARIAARNAPRKRSHVRREGG